jgi:hypothetical protein
MTVIVRCERSRALDFLVRRPWAVVRAHPAVAALAACLALQCVPLLVTRVLPFHDAPGLIGLGGALAHLDDPRTRVREFFDVDYGLYPSIACFGWAWLAAALHVPVDLAFSAFIALFCLAGPPLALLVVLRAFGRPAGLALLALPVGYHHQIWFGFLGSAAGITGMLLALGFARRMVDSPGPAGEARTAAGPHLGLAAALLFVAFCHPFSLALALALVAPVLFWPAAGLTPARRLATRAMRLACFVPTAAVLAVWARGFFGGASARGSSLTGLLARQLALRRPPLSEDLGTFAHWLGGGYLGRVDEVVVAVALLALSAFLALGTRDVTPARDRTVARRQALWLGWGVVLLAGGYLLLPDKVYWPTYWWGVRVRCAVPLFLLAIVCVRPARRGLPGWAVAPSALAAALFACHVAGDFHTHWRGRALAGFDEAISAIPPGQSLLALPVLPDPHYTLGHPYLGQYYVARTGGRATPYLLGHPGSYWVTMKPPPASPPWGDPTQFAWGVHGLGYDYFLVEQPLTGPPRDPLAGAPRGAVALISARGAWRLYRRERPPLPGE